VFANFFCKNQQKTELKQLSFSVTYGYFIFSNITTMEDIMKNKPVRFYFELGIDYVFPVKTSTYSGSDDEWFSYRCELLSDDIQKKLPASFDEIIFCRFTRFSSDMNFFTIFFSISKCHDFIPNDVCLPRKSDIELKIKKYPLLKVKESIETEISNSLCTQYYISDISLKYIASRWFIFEIYFGGFITVERIFTSDEIHNSGGVREALSEFVEEMVVAIGECGLDGDISQTITRRNRENQYVFEISLTSHYGFNERDVDGEMGLLRHNMNIDDIRMIGIDNKSKALDVIVSDVKCGYRNLLEGGLPADVSILKFGFDFIDQDDDVYEVDDAFLMTAADFNK